MNDAERDMIMDRIMGELEREAQFVQDVVPALHELFKEFQDGNDLDVVMCELSHVLDEYEKEQV